MNEAINGFYDDNGNKLNPDLYPKPTLCLSCRKDEDKSEEMLCILNRIDQRSSKEFLCGAYDNKYK